MENSTLILSPQRRLRVFTVGIAAMISLYALVAFVAEPTRGFAANDSSIVEVVIASGLAITCTPTTLTLPTITEDGDTSFYHVDRDINCNVRTNDTEGYTLAWQVTTGSGGTATGYMINQFEDVITPFRYTQADSQSAPTAWDGTAVPTSVSAWGGRVSATSHVSDSPLTWGADSGDTSEKWMAVSTGATTTVATANNESPQAGDDYYIGFRVQVGTAKIQPTGTYQATVVFTTTNQ
ncbi:hypothetical protein KJ996_04645 [Patescibacteria group bacterium]|nr:hypothetical protein [Patescibacteria group bacterium]